MDVAPVLVGGWPPLMIVHASRGVAAIAFQEVEQLNPVFCAIENKSTSSRTEWAVVF